jgi:preprotein translocase subunit SecB
MDFDLKSKDCFELALRAVGNFELEQDIDEKLKKSFVNANAPAIMFPYVRSFITTLTSNLGNVIGPLLIPIQFFQGELNELELDK